MVAQNAFLDLRRNLKEIEDLEIQGALREVRKSGTVFLYDRVVIGGRPVDRYLGADDPAVRYRAQRAKELRDASRELVKLLRSQGCLAPDRESGSVLLNFARAGIFSSGGVLAGTFAFRAYEAELGVRLGEEASVTRDIDFAMPKALKVAGTDPNAQDVLENLGYRPETTSIEASAQPWRWAKGELEVEFLTPNTGKPGQVTKLGVPAQQLKFLEYSLENPLEVPVVYQSGILVKVPDPARFAIHKLIVADRRGDKNPKSIKDRMQARQLVDVLSEDRPDDLFEALDNAMGRGKAWKKAILAQAARIKGMEEKLGLSGQD